MTHHHLKRALEEIARLGPSEEPGDHEHDTLEEAESHGLKVGLWQAADIARRALAASSEARPIAETSVRVAGSESSADQGSV
ncbi:MAG: hypothetical protein WCJ64_03345 [Rhodospirillaceae bacterium]